MNNYQTHLESEPTIEEGIVWKCATVAEEQRTGTNKNGDGIWSPTTQHPVSKYLFSENKFEGHTDAITSICCIEPSLAFVSGSRDGTARLWSIQTGQCLRIFVNPSTVNCGGVNTIRAIDNVTFLTGYDDTSIRLWDAVSGVLVRVYSGHTGEVTDIAVADDDTSFITTSVDRTIKIWVLTAVQNQIIHDPHNDSQSDTTFLDGLCRGADPL
jgi:WD40 repeat protein